MKRAIVAVIAALTAASSWAAGGTTAAASLKIGLGARGQALGEAYSASSAGADALHWNPAGLSGERRSFLLGFQPMVDGASLGHAAASGRFGGWSFGAGFSSLRHDDLDAFDDVGNREGSFKAQDQTFLFGAARGGDRFAWGVTGKYWRSEIDGESAAAPAVDAGVAFASPFSRRMRHAFAVRNVGGDVSFIDQKDPLPMTGVVGSSLRLKAVGLTLDAAFERDDDPWFAGGLEWSVFRRDAASLDLRAGYNTRRSDTEELGGASFGLGLGIRSFSLDYAWIPFGDLGDAHALTLSWRAASEPAPLKTRPAAAATQRTVPAAKGKIESGTTGRRTLENLEAPRRRK